jgi:thiol-disulfide isomerase/thioredoxin
MKRREFLARTAQLAAGSTFLVLPFASAASQPHAFYQNAFTGMNGDTVKFSSYLGRPVVLNFWATWCPPCVKEMPDLDQLQKKHTGISFVGVAVDTASNVNKFVQKVQVDYPLLVAGHGGIKLMRELGNDAGGLPFTVVFNAAGQPLTRILGIINPDSLDSYLSAMPPSAS